MYSMDLQTVDSKVEIASEFGAHISNPEPGLYYCTTAPFYGDLLKEMLNNHKIFWVAYVQTPM